MTVTRTARERARDEVSREIRDEARRRLAEEGAARLSLRAVARSLGMVSSAVYRYYPSRDDLLTALIVDSYDALGAAAEAAAARPATDPAARWLAVCEAVRDWARAHPHEYALLYGSPVPGYVAPAETAPPAARVALALVGVVVDAAAAGRLAPPAPGPPLSPAMAADATRMAAEVVPGVPAAAVVPVLTAWTQLFGMVGFELFGHLVGSVADPAAFFRAAAGAMAHHVGLRATGAEEPADDV